MVRGDKQWTGLDSDNVASSVDDIVFCNGVFFALDSFGAIYHCELDPNPKTVPLCSSSPFRYDRCKKYFAESEYGKLWVVLKKLELNDDNDFAIYFEIYEFNSETKEWTIVRSLRGKALFLSSHGNGRCIAASAGESRPREFIKDNSIYFVDGEDANFGSGSLNLSVFEWESKQTRKLYQPRSWNCHMFWVTPT
ncbi:unnamed protein product [Arabis nemorensis]|uniref:KIB1-4 beta-propeller domain-containing protein n=1 Tax=Arabis nemorensis TaxID=586526 RepID=A0A565BQZ9_9BRAS|nr:unnamed protein product [Arabis nemorensis]